MLYKKLKYYTWINDHKDYDLFENANSFPLLLPDDIERKKRWEKILVNYNVTFNENIEYADKKFSNQHTNHDDIIVILDINLKPLVELYSYETSRTLLVLKKISDIEEIIKSLQPNSILFVLSKNEANNFNLLLIKEYLYLLNKDIQWGIITGEDIHAINFMLLKNVLNNINLNDLEVLDILNSNEELSEEKVFSILNKENNTLIIAAHGEGAHINLKYSVICGQITPKELDKKNSILHNGCSNKYCKRSSFVNNKFIKGYEFNVNNLFLLSCNGFSTSKELYPSNLSTVLSLIDGKVSNIVTTDISESFSKEDIRKFYRLIKSNHNFSDIVNIYNDISYNHTNKMPFLLVGDPFLDTRIQKDKDIYVTKTPKKKCNDIFLNALNENAFSIGNKYLIHTVINNKNYLQNINKKIDVLVQDLNIIQKNLNVFIMLYYHIHNNENISVLLKEHEIKSLNIMYKKTRELEEIIFNFLNIINNSVNTNIMNNNILSKYLKAINFNTTQIYKNFAISFNNKNLLKEIEYYLSSFYIKEPIQCYDKCLRCDSNLEKYQLKSYNIQASDRIHINCRNCGLISNKSSNSTYLKVVNVNLVNNNRKLKIKLSPINVPHSHLSRYCIIFGEVVDKSNGNVIYNILSEGVLSAEEFILDIPLPSNMGRDLHTIRIVTVVNHEIMLNRIRFVT